MLSMGTSKEIRKKIILLGDGAVGKTSLIRRLVVDKFDDKYILTIGSKVTAKTIHIVLKDNPNYKFASGIPLGSTDTPNLALVLILKLQVWDILGQKGYKRLHKSTFKGTDGVLFVADITRKDTLLSIENYWVPEVQSIVGYVPFVIMANKSDLMENAEFNGKDLGEFASKYKAPFFITSAKSGDNVRKAFYFLGKRMIEQKGGEIPTIKEIEIVGEEKGEIVTLVDRIIDDFCESYDKFEEAMPILRRQFELAGLDLNRPILNALINAVDRLAKVEMGYQKKEIAEANRTKRLKWVKEVDAAS